MADSNDLRTSLVKNLAAMSAGAGGSTDIFIPALEKIVASETLALVLARDGA